MKLSKNVRYLVRVRDYETVHIEVGAEISNYDLGYTDDRWARRGGRDIDELHDMLNAEVDRLARAELETVAEWSEISPNLAEDFLSTQPAYLQRNQHANKKIDPPPAGGRRVRRGTDRGGGSSPTSPPTRPAA